MPEWLIPTITALIGGGGLGAFAKQLASGRSSVYKSQLQFIETLQEERQADRADRDRLEEKVDNLALQTGLYQQWSFELLAWGMAGGPTPPGAPTKPKGLK